MRWELISQSLGHRYALAKKQLSGKMINMGCTCNGSDYLLYDPDTQIFKCPVCPKEYRVEDLE